MAGHEDADIPQSGTGNGDLETEDRNTKVMKVLSVHKTLIEFDAKRLGRFTAVRFWLASAIRQVSVNLRAFNTLVSDGMASPAYAMIRMQLEVGTRCNALFLVEDPDSLCQHILHGQKIGSLKDSQGSKMTDAYLFQRFREKNTVQWNEFLTRIQEIGCMHVHFSAASAQRSVIPIDANKFALRDLGEDDFVSESERTSVIFAMEVATLLAGTVIGDAFRHIPQPYPED